MKKEIYATKFLLIIIIGFYFNSAFSQTYRLKSKLASSIDIVIGGDFGFRLISGDTKNQETKSKVQNREQFERQKLNHRIGINYYQGIGGSFSMKTGFRFANPGFNITSINPIDINQNVNEIQKTYLDIGNEYKYKYQMIEIPLGVKYVFDKSFCKPYLEFGVAANYYWKTIVEEKTYEGASSKQSINEDINRVNYISFFATGGNFEISENIAGFTQLVGRYQLNNLRKDEVVEKILGLGLEMGVRYYL